VLVNENGDREHFMKSCGAKYGVYCKFEEIEGIFLGKCQFYAYYPSIFHTQGL